MEKLRRSAETVPYVRYRTFNDPTARIVVERATHSEKKIKLTKTASVVVFEKTHPAANGLSAIRQRVTEIENILRGFNQKKKKHLNPDEKIKRGQLLDELTIIRKQLM